MFLLFPSLFLAIYSFCSGVLPLRLPLFWKAVLGLIILLIALKYQVYLLGGGTFFEPYVKGVPMLIYEALYGGLVVLTAILFLKDVCNLGFWILTKMGLPLDFSLNRNRILFGAMFIALIAGFWGMWESIKIPEVRDVTLRIKNLPPQWQGAKIALLSDLHIGPVQGAEWLTEVVRRTNATKPDLILITGDFVDGTVSKTLAKLKPLTGLEAKYGVYAIPGNHEYYSGYAEWIQALGTLGLKMLENENVVIQKDGGNLIIGGTTDLGASRFGLEAPSLKKTFANTPNGARILLAHQPKTGSLGTEPFDLQLSGHTHGGHLFFLYPLLAYFNDGLVSGEYARGDRVFYVNRGTGLWNGFSMRLGVPSEITNITLEPK